MRLPVKQKEADSISAAGEIYMTIFANIDLTVKKKQGDLGVARAIYEYTKLGYAVFAPLSEANKYDLVVDDGICLRRVQVKTSRVSKQTKKDDRAAWIVQLRTNGGNTKKRNTRFREAGDYDILCVSRKRRMLVNTNCSNG